MSAPAIAKSQALGILTKLKVQALNIRASPRFSPEFEKWRRDVRVTIENLFPNKPQHLADFLNITFNFPVNTLILEGEFERAFRAQIETIEAILDSMMQEIQDFWPEEVGPTPDTSQTRKASLSTPEFPTQDAQTIFVVHGRNSAARDSLFAFLRTIGLKPLEWSQAVSATGKASPYVGEVLEAAFRVAQAVVVLMTPDDYACLRPEFQTPDDGDHEKLPTPQARPNVLFEAGMAMGSHSNRTIIVEMGTLRPCSDIGGRHVIKLDNSTQRRQDLAMRLKDAGCPINLTGTDWHTAGKFEVSLSSEAPVFPAARGSDLDLSFEVCHGELDAEVAEGKVRWTMQCQVYLEPQSEGSW